MGRLPCRDMMGMKKGPWTPEEDILLVSYVQQHGPGNWKSVPSRTGLKRCSKSCRLRWTNYLRPGIKRGSFTDQEEKMIIQLQDLLGNKWAAIASYLPERTDNDIKNFWNTHLKKKLKGHETGFNSSDCRGQWERRLQTDINTAKQALQEALSMEETGSSHHSISGKSADLYACSTENIARLLKGWVKNKPKSEESNFSSISYNINISSTPSFENKNGIEYYSFDEQYSLLSTCFESSSDSSRSNSPEESFFHGNENPLPEDLLSMENWLLEDEDQEKDHLTSFSVFNDNIEMF